MPRTPEDWTVVDGTLVMAGDRLVANTGGYSNSAHPTACRLENMANAEAIALLPRLAKAAEAALVCVLREYGRSLETIVAAEYVALRAVLKELERVDV